MDCPNCKIPLNQFNRCTNCNYDLDRAHWVIIKKVYPPNELILESVLQSYGIPVKLISKEVAQIPFSIGPLAEIKIAVPESEADTAVKLLDEISELE